MTDLLKLSGELAAIGDLTQASEVLPLIGQPRLLLHMADGRLVMLAGLTKEECRAAAAAFLAPARFTVSTE